LDSKEKNFGILLDIGVGLGSELKFKSMDLNFNEFPISKMFKPFLNRNLGFDRKVQNSNQRLKTKDIFEIQGKDLNFKRRFSPMDLNLIYIIELKGRFQKEIGSNFEWTWVN
jgi:hypothetical protein